MAQIVHDLAPGANLAFATAFNGMLDFADNIRALKTAGSKVIVDDVSYFDEPYFQDGPVSVAVNQVTNQGVTYFSSAANNNIISGGKDVTSFEAPAFRPGACAAPLGGSGCMDFNPAAAVDSTYAITIPGGHSLRIALQWAQPWNGVTTDFDMALVAGGSVVASSVNDNLTTQEPFEFLGVTNNGSSAATVQLMIQRFTGDGGDTANPRLKTIIINNGDQTVRPTEYTTSTGGDIVGPSIFGHNGAKNAMSTAAVPFDDSSTPEAYSSRGPLKLYFGPVSGSTPAAPLGTPKRSTSPTSRRRTAARRRSSARTSVASSGSSGPPRRPRTPPRWRRWCATAIAPPRPPRSRPRRSTRRVAVGSFTTPTSVPA